MYCMGRGASFVATKLGCLIVHTKQRHWGCCWGLLPRSSRPSILVLGVVILILLSAALRYLTRDAVKIDLSNPRDDAPTLAVLLDNLCMCMRECVCVHESVLVYVCVRFYECVCCYECVSACARVCVHPSTSWRGDMGKCVPVQKGVRWTIMLTKHMSPEYGLGNSSGMMLDGQYIHTHTHTTHTLISSSCCKMFRMMPPAAYVCPGV